MKKFWSGHFNNNIDVYLTKRELISHYLNLPAIHTSEL